MARSFTVVGEYASEGAALTWHDGTLSGFPADALTDVQVRLAQGDPVASTATGPWFPVGSPEAALIVIRSVLDAAVELGDVPVVETQPDELADDEAASLG